MLAVAGLPPIPAAASEEQIEALRAVLGDHAESMTRAGVAITVSDWAALSALERGCWLVAKRRVEILAIIEEQQAGGDELAAAASLLLGQASEGVPAVLARGLDLAAEPGAARSLLRDKRMDLFR